MTDGRTALIIPAAGSGQRMQSEVPKPYLRLGGMAVLEHTMRAFCHLESLVQVIIPTKKEYVKEAEQMLRRTFPSRNVLAMEGGRERQNSIQKALSAVLDDVEWVIIHDAVRPFIQKEDIARCIEDAKRKGAAIVAVPVKDTIKQVEQNGFIRSTPERKKLWQAQTPQIFRKDWLTEAYMEADEKGYVMTDDASALEQAGRSVYITEGARSNFKLTYPLDFEIAEQMVQRRIASSG